MVEDAGTTFIYFLKIFLNVRKQLDVKQAESFFFAPNTMKCDLIIFLF